MKSSKYLDISSINQIIGCIFSEPKILEADDKYFFDESDFIEDLHKIIFGTIYNLHQHGVKVITLEAIEDYLAQRPKQLAIYESKKGETYLLKCAESCKPAAFDYYYQRLKKMTLFRTYENIGMNLSWLYDPDDILDTKKLAQQEDWVDNTSLEEIANLIDDKILSVRMKCIDNTSEGGVQAGDSVDELLENLKQNPEVGYPLYGTFTNTVVRGARLKKFYLRSAATGVGKTRAMIGDACFIGCSQMYDLKEKKWISLGAPQATMYIATEQDLSEVQTMMIAFISGVDEEHILTGTYYVGEEERITKAAQVLKQSKIYFKSLPDFSLQDIENTIKRGIRENDVQYIFLDYIHTSMKILEEITRRSGGVRLREDNILFMISIRLKDICNQYGVFILSATQLNSDYVESETPDQNLLRGAKSIADKIDVGMIMLEVTEKDRESLQQLVSSGGFVMPNVKISVYKNRRGRWKGIYLWCNADRGTCRINPIFVTKFNYELVKIEDFKIKVEEESSF